MNSKKHFANYLRENPVIFTRLGFSYDPPLKDDLDRPLVFNRDFARFGRLHRQFSDIGVKLHTCILHLGWMGINEYDYSLTDETLEELYKLGDGALVIPRVKLNVPIDWCRENPKELFVYYGGPSNSEQIRNLVGTPMHDYLGFDSPTGYFSSPEPDGFKDKRSNVDGVIARQSFSSEVWLRDAGEALCRLIEHIEKSKYSDMVIGYHIAYGVSGETNSWGRPQNRRFGDYGITNLRQFYNWGVKKYGGLEKLKAAWKQPELKSDNVKLPSPQERYFDNDTAESFFRAGNNGTIIQDYDSFANEINAKALDYFCGLVKRKNPEYITGAFFGYYKEMVNTAYAGHLNIDTVLNSQNIDFLAGPKSYVRCIGGDPGGEMVPSQSINRKKIWMDELDNRTHLAKAGDDLAQADLMSSDFKETAFNFYREFAKNKAHNSGFWWMDLGDGWFDSPEILALFKDMMRLNGLIGNKKAGSLSDVLVVSSEKGVEKANISYTLRDFIADFMREILLCGVRVDEYRPEDLPEIDLSKYKIIIFAYVIELNSKLWKRIEAKIPRDMAVVFNYAAGVWNDEKFSLDNTSELTGFRLAAADSTGCDCPQFKVDIEDGVTVLYTNPAGEAKIAVREYNGRKSIINLQARVKAEILKPVLALSGCKFVVPKDCFYYGNDRFFAIFAKENVEFTLKLPQGVEFGEDMFTGEKYSHADKIKISLKKYGYKFYLIIRD